MQSGPGTAPTAFPELNDLLAELVTRVESILGNNLVGMYLTGSFALGAGDLHSDCDFLVVTETRVTADQERALRELHDEIPTRSGQWARDVEGSYAPKAELRTLAALDKPWLYVDRGSRAMEWSTHCNTEDVRWTLREHGVTLVGPAPRELVDPVPADALRSRMRRLISSFLPDLSGWISFDTAWAQRYAVATLCRMLYTLDTGTVASKVAALEWAKRALPSRWHELIENAQEDRARGWDPRDRPREGSVDATLAFAEYARERAAQSAR